MLQKIRKVIFAAKRSTITINIATLQNIADHIRDLELKSESHDAELKRLKMTISALQAENSRLTMQICKDYERFEEIA